MIKSRTSIVAACVRAHLSLNVCNEIMKREIDFTPRTAERSIMVDWPRILGTRPRRCLPCPSPCFQVSLCVARRCLKSLELSRMENNDSRLGGELGARTKREKWSSKSREGEQILRDECAVNGCRGGGRVLIGMMRCEKSEIFFLFYCFCSL